MFLTTNKPASLSRFVYQDSRTHHFNQGYKNELSQQNSLSVASSQFQDLHSVNFAPQMSKFSFRVPFLGDEGLSLLAGLQLLLPVGQHLGRLVCLGLLLVNVHSQLLNLVGLTKYNLRTELL